jgi:betaine-aldehyde dehydrogenase
MAQMSRSQRPPVSADIQALHMIIGGERVGATDGQTFDIIDPATGRAIATAPLGDAADVDRAVLAAQTAFEARGGWSSWPAEARGRALQAFAGVVRDHVDELADLESRNIGKPISAARADASTVAAVFDYYSGAASKLFGETIPVSAGGLDFTLREPIGVVGLIVPWNYPMVMASWKLGPALAAGNTCILKPASYSPMTAIRLGELALDAGLPVGVMNVVTGPGERVGAAIAEHPGIGKVAFTGETRTGQDVMRRAAGTVKKVSLELGGKSANVVFADADLPRFAAAAVWAIFDNLGQDCTARSRILVERTVHDEMLALFADATRKLRLGRPSEPDSELGTLVSARQRERVLEYIALGQREGAELVLGGVPPQGPQFAGGAYLEPAIFDRVRPDMRIATEEIFGPVVGIIPFDSEAEAIRIANATPYGLSGSVWSRDIGRALRTAKGIKSGVISVNSNRSVHIEAPFGGYRMSGVGRELGMHAPELYTELKNVYVDLDQG